MRGPALRPQGRAAIAPPPEAFLRGGTWAPGTPRPAPPGGRALPWPRPSSRRAGLGAFGLEAGCQSPRRRGARHRGAGAPFRLGVLYSHRVSGDTAKGRPGSRHGGQGLPLLPLGQEGELQPGGAPGQQSGQGRRGRGSPWTLRSGSVSLSLFPLLPLSVAHTYSPGSLSHCLPSLPSLWIKPAPPSSPRPCPCPRSSPPGSSSLLPLPLPPSSPSPCFLQGSQTVNLLSRPGRGTSSCISRPSSGQSCSLSVPFLLPGFGEQGWSRGPFRISHLSGLATKAAAPLHVTCGHGVSQLVVWGLNDHLSASHMGPENEFKSRGQGGKLSWNIRNISLPGNLPVDLYPPCGSSPRHLLLASYGETHRAQLITVAHVCEWEIDTHRHPHQGKYGGRCASGLRGGPTHPPPTRHPTLGSARLCALSSLNYIYSGGQHGRFIASSENCSKLTRFQSLVVISLL